MRNKWKVLYYENPKGECPIQNFIDSKSLANQAKVLNLISFLEEKGPDLPRPYSDILQDGIHELRIKLSGDQIRILYFFCYREYIILTHSFIKRTDKIPEKEIKRAIITQKDFLNRYTEKDLMKLIRSEDENI